MTERDKEQERKILRLFRSYGQEWARCALKEAQCLINYRRIRDRVGILRAALHPTNRLKYWAGQMDKWRQRGLDARRRNGTLHD